MAKVLNPEQFKKCSRGTVFAYGEPWAFDRLLVLHSIVDGGEYWGFWALDPMWVNARNSDEGFRKLDEMMKDGISYPAKTAISKFMSYDGDNMEAFFVLEPDDWNRLCAAAAGNFSE